MKSETDIRARIESSRKELLDLSLQNALLNYRPLSARGVEVVGENASRVFKTLVNEKRSMSFQSVAEDESHGTIEFGEDESDLPSSAGQKNRRLQTGETTTALQKRLLNTYRLANTAIEETGVNTLFLGLGMLRWYESDSSQEERYAPLVLVPVRLERTGVRARFSLGYTGDDLGVNLSLLEKAREDFALNLPGRDALEPLDGKAINIAGYVAQVEELVHQSAPNRWNVEPDRIVLGFFSFNKLLMYLDLGPPSVIENDIIGALFGDHGFTEPQSDIGNNESLDERLKPGDVFHVLDADSSQALAIHEAGRGRNMVIQGPPGTGKSQTIANIIAEAVAQGKRTLFVSEKMAALEVVKRRLDNIGLGNACLELHSHKTNKRETLNELSRTLNLPPPMTVTDGLGGSLLEQLSRTRIQLNEYVDAVNVPVGESGVAPYDAFGELSILEYDKTANAIARRKILGITEWSGAEFRGKWDVVEDLRLRLQNCGVPNLHPFWGSRMRLLLPGTRTELQVNIETTLSRLSGLTTACKNLADATQLAHPGTISAAYDLLTASQRAVGAPNTAGLNLKDPHWESTSKTIWDLVEAGVQWQWIRGTRIHSATTALQDLANSSGALANTMGLDHPTSVAGTIDLLVAAKCAAGAPDADGLDLYAPQWESHAERIGQLLTKGLRWKRIRKEHNSVLLPDAWDSDFKTARLALNTDGRSLLKRLFSSDYKRAKKQLAVAMRAKLPREIDRQISLIDAIDEEQRLRAEINGQYADIVPAIGSLWNGHDTDWEGIEPAIRWWLAVLADVAAGRLPSWTIQMLRKLETRLAPAAVQGMIETLSSASALHESCAQELNEVLDLAYGAEQDDSHDISHLPYEQQRQLISRLLNQCPPGNKNTAKPQGQTIPGVGKTPEELVNEIMRLHRDVGPVLGSHWNNLDTNWEAIAPTVLWWLDVLAEVSAGSMTEGAISHLQVLTTGIGTGGAPKDWQTQAEVLSGALEGYSAPVRELQLSLDMDTQQRFGSSEGLILLPFSEQRQVLREWEANLTRIQDLATFNAGAEIATREGLQELVTIATMNPAAATSLTRWFELAWYETIVETALSERPALRDFDGQLHEGRIERFKSIDKQSLEYNRGRVAFAHRIRALRPNQLPSRLVKSDSAPEAEQIREQQQQLRVLQHEIQKRSRHKPIRQLLNEAGRIIQDLKPVFMMSPLSIANYLDLDSVAFDLVVFDEASQVRPVDALGALLRAEKAVVVGDSRQLPPSSFFDRVVQSADDEDEDESVTADIESILGLFASRGAPSRSLRWHYRSRHESLIAVSNQEFYDGDLVVFPSPDVGREATGLRFHHLPDAVYDRGHSATNRREAEAVAGAVMAHAVQTPGLSLGVAAFSQSQARAIEDQLEMLRLQDDSGEEFFAAHPEEPFFVKNLENVQGDERDVIFISIGYGRDATGQVFMNFGPLNNQGGERRLNVLITRAKHQCHVFTNLRADDIDLGKTSSIGVRTLKTFLAYAETGVLPVDVPYESDFSVDSPFQREVARRLENLGYQVHQEVASGGKFVDIGIVDPQRPGRYIIGIECDGASYHSSRSARDRDRLREEVLEGLGWTLHRVWSTDWFKNSERELGRTVEAIEEASRLTKNASLGYSERAGVGIEVPLDADSDEVVLKATRASRRDSSFPIRSGRQVEPASSEVVGEQSAVNNIKPDTSEISQLRQDTGVDTELDNTQSPESEDVKDMFDAELTRQGPSLSGRLSSVGLTTVDKRPSGGVLWVIGGQELKPKLEAFVNNEIRFNFAPKGGQATKGLPAWWTKAAG